MERGVPKKAKEVLTLLSEGAELEFHRSQAGYFRVISKNKAPWLNFHRKALLYAIRLLHQNGMITIEEMAGDITKISLTAAGKNWLESENKKTAPLKEWDRKWRLIFFDIPEEKKKFRDSFRYHLQKLGLVEFQRSSFISPFPCFREVEKIAEHLQLKDHIVFVTAETLSNEFHFKQRFELI